MRTPVPAVTSKSLPIPAFTQSGSVALGIQSTLQDLPCCTFSVATDCSLQALMERFIQFPDLPGVLISGIGGDRLLSRQQLLECLLHTGQVAPNESLQRLLYLANDKALILPVETSILKAAKQALKRSTNQQNAPILVQQPNGACQLLDARTLNLAHWQIRGIETQFRYERLQMQLLQSEKMAALGRLVDGVAHEILDPVGFIWGNLSYIASYVQQQSKLLTAYEAALPAPPAQITQLAADIELDYLRSDLPAAIKSAQGGAYRLKQLATSLQNFCHIDEIHPRPTDINTLLDSTLHLLTSRITTPITIDRSYGKLPPIPCYAGQLSQVFMTLFTYVIDTLLAQAYQPDYASGQMLATSQTPKITVTTHVRVDKSSSGQKANKTIDNPPNAPRWVSITIRDNGQGLLDSSKAQILNSFSTKSRSRKETGLALSYQIITAKHGGRFRLRSLHTPETDNSLEITSTGTEFEILLPMMPKQTDPPPV
ncbi:MAG: histidine kinase [Leptolyngbya foveolarum]|uniref:Histidine kinase n=1 Tax=Leptolyngbya foveolarum TaxID=47253 RepID=A0A2W4UIY2_9CYAN|nr:MAG: histidine kinase [Leptolyngbya foveolarum]